MAIKMTTRGFSINVGDHDVNYYYDLLSSAYRSTVLNRISNQTRLDAVSAIRQLIVRNIPQYASLEDWLVEQISLPTVTDMKLRLIEDTLGMMKTGHRKLPLARYGEMILGEIEMAQARNLHATLQTSASRIERQQHVKKLTMSIRQETTESGLLYTWLKTEAGFADALRFFMLVLEP